MRADVREELQRVAADELELNGNYVALVSAKLVEVAGDDAVVSYYGSPIEAEIERIVRWHERRRARHVALAFLLGVFLGWLVTSIVWDVMT